jgi:hypothetical protein
MRISLDIQLPPAFPEKHTTTAEQCAVKKHLEHPLT